MFSCKKEPNPVVSASAKLKSAGGLPSVVKWRLFTRIICIKKSLWNLGCVHLRDLEL